MALGIKSGCMSLLYLYDAKLRKIIGMLRTKDDKVGCYLLNKLTFNDLNKNQILLKMLPCSNNPPLVQTIEALADYSKENLHLNGSRDQ